MPFVLWCCTAGSLGRPNAVSFFGVARRGPLDQGEELDIVCRYLVDEMKARLKCAQLFEIEVYGKKVHKQACRSHNDAAPPRWVRSGTIGCRRDARRAAGSLGGGGRGAPDHCDRVYPGRSQR